MQKFIQTYIIFKERVILRIVKLFFHNNLTDSTKGFVSKFSNKTYFETFPFILYLVSLKYNK